MLLQRVFVFGNIKDDATLTLLRHTSFFLLYHVITNLDCHQVQLLALVCGDGERSNA